MTKLTPRQRKSIAYNKKHGLLCACNKVRVPYGREGKHGTRVEDGILHGYHDCAPYPKVRPYTRGEYTSGISIREEISEVILGHAQTCGCALCRAWLDLGSLETYGHDRLFLAVTDE